MNRLEVVSVSSSSGSGCCSLGVGDPKLTQNTDRVDSTGYKGLLNQKRQHLALQRSTVLGHVNGLS